MCGIFSVIILVPLDNPIPVYIVYWTAWVDESNTIHFRNDIYGRDDEMAANFSSE